MSIYICIYTLMYIIASRMPAPLLKNLVFFTNFQKKCRELNTFDVCPRPGYFSTPLWGASFRACRPCFRCCTPHFASTRAAHFEQTLYFAYPNRPNFYDSHLGPWRDSKIFPMPPGGSPSPLWEASIRACRPCFRCCTPHFTSTRAAHFHQTV